MNIERSNNFDRNNQAARGRAGLSLIEVMIAIAILSIVLIALIERVHGCIDTAHTTEYQSAAREFAKELMSEIEAGLVDGLQNGTQGNFGDRNYEQITYVIGLGESSTVGSNSMNDNGATTARRMYEKDKTPFSNTNTNIDNKVDSTDPNNTSDPSLSEEPFTRIRIVVTYPSNNPEHPGTYTLERMVPTECSQGTNGISKKKDKDAAAEKANEGKPAPTQTNNTNNNNKAAPKGNSGASGSTSILGGAKK
ncbi:MAG: prepilin-type N-terminal cleavage/methylation domain-containing protein [Planctomycetes bacterium]|nr:prepilin-type N-terminal cleavage/methylation domain-containing protein [Planctomycetota bacterium]